jgi:hypothetical protein
VLPITCPAFSYLAGDLLDLTLDLIFIHDISFEAMEKMSGAWATPMAESRQFAADSVKK